MRKIFIFSILTIVTLKLFSQSHGMSYQAILINEDAQEIPGVDVQGNYIPNQILTIRFTILDENGGTDYQEEHDTQTDQYGMINVTIGQGTATFSSPGTFMDIDWNGTPKDLRVEISLAESLDGFIEFSLEELTFVPYAYHRNITATGTMIIEDVTDLNSDLNVNNGSPTNLTGNLTVDLITDLNGDLNVNSGSSANLSGTLTVDQETNINSDFYVNNGSPTNLSGDLTVLGESTLENVNLTTLNSISDQEEFVATFENTNNGVGDGIKIKLGKARAETGIPVSSGSGISQVQIDQMKDLIGCDLDISAKLPIVQDLVLEGLTADLKMQANLAIGIGNILIDFLNLSLGIPEIEAFPGFDWETTILGVDIGFGIPSVTIGPLSLPDIPHINLSAIGFDGYDLESLDFWGIPEICLSDVIPNPLNFENEFIHFSDANDSKMGSIRAQSVVDWSQNYLNPSFMMSLRGAYTSAIDKNHAKYHFKGKISEALASYKKIGVEYSSGNGDYAEWLERIDSTEFIGAGDIVGVIGGKITKDLTNAEQVMAVSSNPIVLGNTPKEGKEYLGNNVAFMGQIPVKIMGPVSSGDYIVGKGDIQGYGVAIHPENMTLGDFKFAIGRAWENNISIGPKMINTVVGVHNGDYITILKQYEERFKKSEERINNIEEKLNLLIENNSINNN